MKFWESDDKAKQAKPAKSIATASKVEAQPVQAKAAPAEAVVKEVIPAVQVAEVKAIEPVVQTPNEPVAQAPKVEMTSELPQPIAAAKEQVASQDDTQSAVGKTVEAWANAWRTKNTTAYLSFYSAKFAPKGMSRKAWTAQRKRRVGGKRGEIKLTLDNLNIVADAKKATATFSQHYANRKYSDDVVKKLSLKNVDGQWVIVKESTKAASAK
jgi:ketosteroid isomerase-like protein